MKSFELPRLNLQFFAEGDAETSEISQRDDQPSEESNLDANTDASATQETEQPAEKTFTQSEIDELIKKRLERVNKKYADYDDVKKKAEEYEKQLEEKRLAELSEQERLQEIAKKHEEEKQTLAQQLEELQTRVQQERITNEFIKVATSHNVAYIDDAIKLADLSAVTVGEDGKVEGIEDAIKALVEHKPFLLSKPAPKPVGEPSNGKPERTDKTKEQLLQEAAAKFKQTGKPEDMAAYSKLKRELGL